MNAKQKARQRARDRAADGIAVREECVVSRGSSFSKPSPTAHMCPTERTRYYRRQK